MAEQEHIEMSICVDCVVWFANGDYVETDGRTLEQFTADVDQHCEGLEHVTLGSISCEFCGRGAREADPETETCEAWFSHSSCDTCGSPLGGHREHAVGWLAPTSEPAEKVAS
jgi:hypothetical protein